MSDFTEVDIHGDDTTSSLPSVTEAAASKLGLTGLHSGAIRYFPPGNGLPGFWCHTVSGRDAEGRRVSVTTYTENDDQETT